MRSISGGRILRQACRADGCDSNTPSQLNRKFRKTGAKIASKKVRRSLLKVILTAVSYFSWSVPDPKVEREQSTCFGIRELRLSSAWNQFLLASGMYAIMSA
jgi:hypothetical protein